MWIAPYVLVTRQRISANGTTSVRWFDAQGKLLKELAGANVDANTEFVSEQVGGQTIIHGVGNLWKFELPRKPGPSGYITASGDTFALEHHPQEGEIAVDIYVAGKLANTLGPFPQSGEDIHLSADGSLAVLVRKAKEARQIVVAGLEGKLRFKVDCGEDVDQPIASLDGKGVLAHVVTGHEPPVRFRFYQKEGERATFDVGTNGWFAAWGTADGLAVFSTSVGDIYRYKLVDCSTGNTIWEIPEPVARMEHQTAAVCVVKDRVLFAGRTYAAVDVANGRMIARCEPNAAKRGSRWFALQGERIFVMTEEEFAEINLADIAARQNGWQ